MWYWYELLFLMILTDIFLKVFFKKYTNTFGMKMQKYICKKMGFNTCNK